MANVILIDDHPVILTTLTAVVEKEGYTVKDKFLDGQIALRKLRELNYEIDVIIIDISLPGLDGLELTQKIKNHLPLVKVLIFTTQNSIYFARRCMEAGASGFVSKSHDLSELGLALNTILKGYNFFPEGTLSNFASKKSHENLLDSLSKKEFLVMKLLVNGNNNNHIAKELSISEKTVSTYKKRIFDKLGINHVLDLADFAKRNNVI
ncbi:TPA: response regulator [Vibrio metschnikovii]